MDCSVIIPVGPGHRDISERANRSVETAWKHGRGPFKDMRIQLVMDDINPGGRGYARNLGMDSDQADWYFFLDADDRMVIDAFYLLNPKYDATFGAVMLDGRIAPGNRWPVSRSTILAYGARGTLSMGCFVRGDLGIRFDEDLDVGEDFDFYMRLPSFIKIRKPLVNIGYKTPSATGPRGYKRAPWLKACDGVIARYR